MHQKRIKRRTRHRQTSEGIERVRGGVKHAINKSEALLSGRGRLRKGEGVLAGVCEGIGDYYEINPALVRLGFGVGTIATGGMGLLAYLVLALAIPHEDQGRPISYKEWQEYDPYEEEEEPAFVDLQVCDSCSTALKPQAQFCHQCGAKT